ncbi:MAG: M48 family metalloprotease [Desulfobacterales bacterium]|nr:M48 family metalloprotease [Desulfobacterales bacterium]
MIAILKKLSAVVLITVWVTGMVFPGVALGISIGKEKELAEEFLKIVNEKFKLIKDPFLVAYVNEVGNRVVALLPAQPFDYHFYVIHENVYNAFAGPGGHVFINSGLIEAMETEGELAGILTHEICHVMRRHISDRIDRSTKINLASLAGMVAGVFLGGGSQIGSAVTVGSMAAGQSAQLKYSRDDEMEADQMGLKYLDQLGYGPEGLLTVLKKIRAKQWYGSDMVPSYLSTHPAVEDRILYIDGWQATHPLDRKIGERDSRRFERARIRLAALYGDAELSLKRFAALAEQTPNRALIRYGYGLILARNSRYSAAISEFTAVKTLDPSAGYVLSALGQSQYALGQYAAAISTLTSAVRESPDDPDAWFHLGRTWILLGDYAKAVDSLERVLDLYSQYPQAAAFLGEAYGKMEQLGPAHFYLGLHHKEQNNFRIATFHLKRALELLRDPIKREKAEAMLKEMDDEGRWGKTGPSRSGKAPQLQWTPDASLLRREPLFTRALKGGIR